MRKTLLVLSVHANEDTCKICRDYQAACVKAHTKEACKVSSIPA
jgi:hypothetical protein